MKIKIIKQGAMLPASPAVVYQYLLDSKLHSKFTGDVATISKKVGGKFSTFSGYATGKNLVLVPGKKIVQTWRAADWPKGAESEITFLLKPTKGGTKLMFTHKGVPEGFVEDVTSGWKEYYWEPLKEILGKK